MKPVLMLSMNPNNSLGIGERARLGRSQRRPRRWPFRTSQRRNRFLAETSGSARGRAEQPPMRLRSSLTLLESVQRIVLPSFCV